MNRAATKAKTGQSAEGERETNHAWATAASTFEHAVKRSHPGASE